MATATPPESISPLDVDELREKVRHIYRAVARQPQDRHFHFETGRALAARLGYAALDLARLPEAALESFAGVGYYFDFAAFQPPGRPRAMWNSRTPIMAMARRRAPPSVVGS